MKPHLVALAFAGTLLAAGTAFAAPRAAWGYPPPPPGLSTDEIRDYEEDQMERRQEMERAALKMHQTVERRARGFDDD